MEARSVLTETVKVRHPPIVRGPKALEIVPGATHLFPEPGALEAVIDLAARWFERHLVRERN